MHLAFPVDTLFYRVLKIDRHWNDVLSGQGAFYTKQSGNRYSGLGLKTVYASPDALVAITEAIFYQALTWHETIGTAVLLKQKSLTPFFTKQHRLWSFRLKLPTTVIDVQDQQALAAFHHPPYVLLNPTNECYVATQDLMAAVLSHPPGPQGRAWGVKAPSVRTPKPPGFQPYQCAFVLQPPQMRLPGVAVDSWALEIEFLEAGTRQQVTGNSAAVDWRRPRFRLTPRTGLTAAAGLQGFAERPNATHYSVNVWHDLDDINFA